METQATDADDLGWWLHVQDLRGWQPFMGKQKPTPERIAFKTRAAAEEAQRTRRADGVLTTITRVTPPNKREPRAVKGPPMRLTK